MIYFIYDEKNNAIKIGVTNNVEKRLRTLQCGNPTKLQIKHTIEGSYKEESILHYHYRKNHLLGEWFTYTDQLQKDLYDNNLEIIIGEYEAEEVIVKQPKYNNNTMSKKDYKVRKRKYYETEDNRVKARELKEKKERRVKTEKTLEELQTILKVDETSEVSQKELAKVLLEKGFVSASGTKNIPIEKVMKFFNVTKKQRRVNGKREYFVIGLGLKQKEA